MKKLERAGVPAGPILNVKEMHEDRHVIDRDMVVAPVHSSLGPVNTIGCPVKFSETPSSVKKGAPLYGEDTKLILIENGYNDYEIEELFENGSVA